MNKFKNINYYTFVSMIMIVVIHYFTTFNAYVQSDIAHIIMYLGRGFGIVAVTMYLTNTAYTSFSLNKKPNYRSIYLYVIIPTLLFQQIQHILFGVSQAQFDFVDGFSGSWFGEMYVYVMLLIPLYLYLHNKSPRARIMLSIWSVIATIIGLSASIILQDSTIGGLQLYNAIPYSGLVYTLYMLINAGIKYINTHENLKIFRIIAIVIIIACGLVQSIAYSGLLSHVAYIRSYFSIFNIAFATLTWLLIYSFDLSSAPEIRTISRASYFLYFCHWIIIHGFEYYAPNFPVNHVWLGLEITIVLALILSVAVFYAYDFIVTKILHL